VAESEAVQSRRRALGESLARRRFAAGLTQTALAPMSLYGRSTVANVEVGRQHVGREFWARCDVAVGAEGELLSEFDAFEALRAGLVAPSPRAIDSVVDSGFLGLLAGVAVGVLPPPAEDPVPPLPTSGPWPERITEFDVEIVRQSTQLHRRLQHAAGGQSCRTAAVALAAWAEGLLRRPATDDTVEAALCAAVAELHNLVGWTEHDLGADERARLHFARGCVLAARAGQRSVMADSYYRLGRISLTAGAAVEALRFFQLGQLAARDDGCLVSVSILHANEAWAYAMLDEPSRVEDALARAGSELARVEEAQVPEFARFITAPADLDGITAVIYGVLAHHRGRGRFAETSAEHAVQAVCARRPGEERSLTFDLISSATAHLMIGDVESARPLANRAVDAAESLGSHRVQQRLGAWWRLAQIRGADRTLEDVGRRLRLLSSA
jgi:hypothetical protein